MMKDVVRERMAWLAEAVLRWTGREDAGGSDAAMTTPEPVEPPERARRERWRSGPERAVSEQGEKPKMKAKSRST